MENGFLKKIDLVAIPAINITAILGLGSFPALDLIESILKITVLTATLIFTIVRIRQIVMKNKTKETI